MKSVSSPLLLAFALMACRTPAHDERMAHEQPTKCVTCHGPEFASTTHPPHENARPTTCGVCHTQTAWKKWRVDHPWYALTGAHARVAADESLAGEEKQVKCFWCHRGDPAGWKDTKKECVACHDADRERSRFPGHEAFQSTCEDCHSTEKWKGAKAPPPPPPEPAVVVEEPIDAGPLDAGSKPKPKPRPVPTAPPTTKPPAIPSGLPPDIVVGPSRRHR